MIRDYIATFYAQGRNERARQAIASEIIRDNTEEGEERTYVPTEEEIDTMEAIYYSSRRAYQYGTPTQQMEYITEHGLDAWQDHVAQIKTEIPKPE